MTELQPYTIVGYAGEYSGIVLSNGEILSCKYGGNDDSTVYSSLIHWLATLPGCVGAADINMIDTTCSSIEFQKIYFRLLKQFAGNYDAFRFLLIHTAYKMVDSLVTMDNTYGRVSRTFVSDIYGVLHPVKYNSFLQLFYSEHHKKLGKSLEEIGFHYGANIYVLLGDNSRKVFKKMDFNISKKDFAVLSYLI